MAVSMEKNPSAPKLLSALAGKQLLGFDTRSWASDAASVSSVQTEVPGRKPAFGGAKPVTVGAKPRVR